MVQLNREDCSYTILHISTTAYSQIYSWVNWRNVEWKNMPKVLTPQHWIQTRVLLVEIPKLYPGAIALYASIGGE